MYINQTGFFIPSTRIPNDYFESVNGLTSEWITQRTGIVTRSRVTEGVNVLSMGLKAVESAIQALPYPIEEVDLIISAGYSIFDTVGTLAHYVQREFGVINAHAVAITSACSSFVNAAEIVQGYFAMGKASKALIVCSEENSYYSHDADPKSGHLWGDAAVAVFLSKEEQKSGEPYVMDILTRGLGHIGKGPQGVYLRPKTEGIVMPDGRDVFMYACKYMTEALETLTQRNHLSINDMDYIVCHQANLRIVSQVARQWKMPESKFINNIQELGNTGSASAMLALAQRMPSIEKGALVGLTVFGGGYSSGGMLIKF